MTDNAHLTRQTTLFSAQDLEDEDQQEDIDFKMVTFSLGGKDYGIDIMKVKEIAKFADFTYVPNTQPFVRGVYNLRGDIISVIDMRTLFGLPAAERSEGEPEEGLIVRLDDGLIGIVVDQIDQVVGISSETIQPPHPIFADVNIKYISGVVEHDDRLYIILDAERVLGDGSEDGADESDVPSSRMSAPVATVPPKSEGESRESPFEAPSAPSAPNLDRGRATAEAAEMVAQTLQTISGFTMTDLNREWVEHRLESWSAQHGGEVQVTSQDDVDEFLAPFYSPYTGRLWEADVLESLRSLLPEDPGAHVNTWNPGCGEGYEAYSVACLLHSCYPDARTKVWASDSDLLNVSTAPNLVFEREAVPDFYEPYIVEGSNGYSFASEIKQMVLFEFSDVTHPNTVPVCDLIVIRDVLSFLPEREQQKVIRTIQEKATATTLVVPGANEDLIAVGGFTDVSHGALRAFTVR